MKRKLFSVRGGGCRPVRCVALVLVCCLLISGLPLSAAAAGTEEDQVNLFMGMFHNYKSNQEYINVLRKKYPGDMDLYSKENFTPYVSELLTLYLANLEDAGFRFGVIERADLCSTGSYVVELTEKGKSVIQITFYINPYDPKAANTMILKGIAKDHGNSEKRKSYWQAMWTAYNTLNTHMNAEKYIGMLLDRESSMTGTYDLVLRGEYDGLGYLFGVNAQDSCLVISPNASRLVFAGEAQKPIEAMQVGETFWFGSYEQDNNVSNGPEPIRWIIVDKEVGSVLAVSEQALDSRRFHETAGNIGWKNASVRTWLNKDFYDAAFEKEEKNLIQARKVEAGAGMDKVFLLSREEAEAFFTTEQERQCSATAYAVSRNAYVNARTGCSWWLLRTSGTRKGNVMSVNSDGTMDYTGGTVQSDKGTVRPAMWIRTTG